MGPGELQIINLLDRPMNGMQRVIGAAVVDDACHRQGQSLVLESGVAQPLERPHGQPVARGPDELGSPGIGALVKPEGRCDGVGEQSQRYAARIWLLTRSTDRPLVMACARMRSTSSRPERQCATTVRIVCWVGGSPFPF